MVRNGFVCSDISISLFLHSWDPERNAGGRVLQTIHMGISEVGGGGIESGFVRDNGFEEAEDCHCACCVSFLWKRLYTCRIFENYVSNFVCFKY